MFQLVAERGYADTTVNALVDVAGVSKTSFYDQFRDKDACFLAAYDTALRQTARSILAGESVASTDEERQRGAVRAIADLIAVEPEATRLVLVECLAAGPDVLEHVEDRFGLLETLLADRLSKACGAPPPKMALKGIIRGLAFLASYCLGPGRPSDFQGSVDALVNWILGFGGVEAASLFETLPAKGDTGEPLSVSTEGILSANDGERALIIAATASLATDEGYPNLTSTRIRRAAGVPRRRFHAIFADARECFLASVEDRSRPLLIAAKKAAREEPDWSLGLRAGMRRFIIDLARSPQTAKLLFAEMPLVAPSSTDWILTHMASCSSALYAAAPAGQRPRPEIAYATGGMIWGLIAEKVVSDQLAQLPEIADLLTFVALLPAIGVDSAAAVLNTSPVRLPDA